MPKSAAVATKRIGALEQRRNNNVRRLLVAATREVNLHITTQLQRRGYAGTRPGHAALLANLDIGGNTISEVAERAAISKQAMARLAVELEELGLIDRTASASDARAVDLTLTRTGRALVRASVAIVDRLEKELEDALGTRSLATLKRGLALLAHRANPRTSMKP